MQALLSVLSSGSRPRILREGAAATHRCWRPQHRHRRHAPRRPDTVIRFIEDLLEAQAATIRPVCSGRLHRSHRDHSTTNQLDPQGQSSTPKRFTVPGIRKTRTQPTATLTKWATKPPQSEERDNSALLQR